MSYSALSGPFSVIWTELRIGRGGRQLLFISYKLGHSKDIQCSTISSWIKNARKFCYTKADNADMDLVGVKAHDVRAFVASKAFYGGTSMDQIMQACHWKSHNTFTRFYLRDLAGQDQSEGSFHLDAFIAAQQVMPPSDKVPGKKTGGARRREPPRMGVSESSDTVERGLHPFKVT